MKINIGIDKVVTYNYVEIKRLKGFKARKGQESEKSRKR